MFYLKKIITVFIVPPVGLIWLGLLGLILIKRFPKFGRALAFLSLIFLLLLSTPLVSQNLMGLLQNSNALTTFDHQAQAIVVLGGGVDRQSPEYGAPNIVGPLLERIKYAAFLFDKTGVPILVTGGDPLNTGIPEAHVMRTVIEEEFLTPVTWIEDRSRDTYENAKFSYEILKPQDLTRIYLVTHAWHMPRAQSIFERVGFDVIAAPTVIHNAGDFSFYQLWPDGNSFHISYLFFRESLGRFWYWLRY